MESLNKKLRGTAKPTGEGGNNNELEAINQKAIEEKSKVVHTGFIAQEVEVAAKKLNYDFNGVDAPKNEQDLYGIRYSKFVVPLVKAVQELVEQNEEQQTQINELKSLLKQITNGGNTASVNLSSSYLEQSFPNPSKGSALIRYHVPINASATIMVTDMKGSVVKSVALNSQGSGQINMNTETLAAGAYDYTLYVNGRKVDAKRMLIAR